MARRLPLGLALAALVALSCSSSKSAAPSSSSSSSGSSGTTPPTDTPADGTQLFSPAIKHVVFEVDYVPGAEPYVGSAPQFGDVWSLFRTNAMAVFDGKKDITLPTTLSGMGKLDDVAAGDMTKQDVLDLATSHRTQTTDAASGTEAYFVVFVNGFLKGDDGTEQDDVLGVSIAGSGVIGIFKPAYAKYYDPKGKSAAAQIVEQMALVHQFGHAVGFVNHGVPIADGNTPHEDTAHGSHCTNPQCVMNYSFESASGAVAFLGKLPIGSQTVLYDQTCLSDARILENNLLSK